MREEGGERGSRRTRPSAWEEARPGGDGISLLATLARCPQPSWALADAGGASLARSVKGETGKRGRMTERRCQAGGCFYSRASPK